mgnify:CR=1 FL=1
MKDLFTDIESFMVRTPSFSVDLLIDSINKKELDNKMIGLDSREQQEQFKEAVLVASYDMYEVLQDLEYERKIKDEYLLNSIYKYFSRNCSRCTPFGLFSTVGFGKITEEKTLFELKNNDLHRMPLIDSNWLFKVIFKYEEQYLDRLKYILDDSVAIHRNRALLFESTKDKDGEKINKKSVNYSRAFEIVSGAAKKFVGYSDIIEELKKEYIDTDEEIFHIYVQSLIKEGYLISDLRPPLTIYRQLEYFIEKLKEYGIDVKIFMEIKKQIEEYKVVPRTEKIKCLLKIYESMKQVYETKHYLAIDSSFSYNSCNLNVGVVKKINKFVDLFLQFNSHESYDLLGEYKSKFIEKYGLSRCVPLVELVDDNVGLGFPSHYYSGYGLRNIKGEYTNPWVKFFEHRYIEAIRTNSIIDIQDEDVRSLQVDKFELDKLPKGMEIYFNYYFENGKEVFQLSDIFGATYAGKSFGRFSHMMKDSKMFFEKINKASGIESGEFCEFTFLPDNLSSGNVIRNTHGASYELSFGTTNSKEAEQHFEISDILVGIDKNKFYLCSATSGERIFPTATNMFNPQLKPKILRLIDDIATDGMKFYNKPWKHLLDKFSYIPTIRYKNFILEQEKWVVRLSDLKINKHPSFGDFKIHFSNFAKEKNLPTWVSITEADQKLLINIEEDRCLSVLQKMIEKSAVTLERYNADVQHPLVFEGKSYCCELVIPLVMNKEYAVIQNRGYKVLNNCVENRIIEPFDGWLYFKIYGAEDNVEYLLGDVLFDFLQQLVANKEIENYFFIQYKDPDFHLRLRIKADKERLLAVQPKILSVFNRLMQDSIISKYCIDCYELELERYGGNILMDFAHQVFYRDSIAVQSIIHEKSKGNIRISDEMLALTIIFFHVQQFKLSLDEIYTFLNCKENNKNYQTEFKKNKDQYMDFVIKYLTNGKQKVEIISICNILSMKHKAMEEYFNEIEEIYTQNKSIKLNILDSLLHMNMNRLFGPNVEFERKMRGFARQAFYNVYNRNKKTGFLKGKEYAEV